MAINHTISDFVARINNALGKNRKVALVPNTNTIRSLLDILESEGFIIGYQLEGPKSNNLKILLKYFQDKSVINTFRIVSKPSRKVYFSKEDILQWKTQNNTFDLLILSTNKGVLTHQKALIQKTGGEVLVSIN